MTYKSEFGNFGEDIACKYLVNNGYKIISRNFRKPWGEIDIITKAPDKTLVFTEVKTVGKQSENSITAEDQLTKSKLTKIKKTASLYAGHYPELIKENKGWQIDLLALTVKEKSVVIKHYKNIAA
ncbi:YraN family protein [Candidatus Wolfebacteria bacterium]|nr:YraN family protein [Candidatus Wolfebacteria bacterium]